MSSTSNCWGRKRNIRGSVTENYGFLSFKVFSTELSPNVHLWVSGDKRNSPVYLCPMPVERSLSSTHHREAGDQKAGLGKIHLIQSHPERLKVRRNLQEQEKNKRHFSEAQHPASSLPTQPQAPQTPQGGQFKREEVAVKSEFLRKGLCL